MQLDRLAQVKRETPSTSLRKDNIYMQSIAVGLSVQMGKFLCADAHNRSESTSSLAT